jgi:hypothetical protein
VDRQYLTDEEIAFYDAQDEMFATPGWKQLMEDTAKEIYQIQANALEVKTWEQVCEERGRAKQLAILLRLEEISDVQRMQLIESRKDEELTEQDDG